MLEELDNERGHGETSILSKAMAWADLRVKTGIREAWRLIQLGRSK